MKLETSPKVTKSKRSLHWCRSISKKYLCTFYYSISQKVITLSGRRFITVSGVLLHYRAVITLSGVFYYIIGQLLQYRAFITLSVGTAPNWNMPNSHAPRWIDAYTVTSQQRDQHRPLHLLDKIAPPDIRRTVANLVESQRHKPATTTIWRTTIQSASRCNLSAIKLIDWWLMITLAYMHILADWNRVQNNQLTCTRFYHDGVRGSWIPASANRVWQTAAQLAFAEPTAHWDCKYNDDKVVAHLLCCRLLDEPCSLSCSQRVSVCVGLLT